MKMASYTFNAIPTKIPVTFCQEIEMTIVKYVWKHKQSKQF
jgi:hypothetical protein